MRERTDEGGSSIGNSMRQSSVVGGGSPSPKSLAPGALMVKSHATNTQRPTHAENGIVQPFDQVMSNFAMYGVANRNTLRTCRHKRSFPGGHDVRTHGSLPQDLSIRQLAFPENRSDDALRQYIGT